MQENKRVLSTSDIARPDPATLPSVSHGLQDVLPKSTSLVSTVPAVRPGAVW
jgi:hypothetical protein